MTPEMLLAVWLTFGTPDDVQKPPEMAVVVWAARGRAEAQKKPLLDALRFMACMGRRNTPYWRVVTRMNAQASMYGLTDAAQEMMKKELEQCQEKNLGWTKKDEVRLKLAITVVKKGFASPLSANPLNGLFYFGKPGQIVRDAEVDHCEIKPAGRLGCWQLYKEVEP